MRFFNAIVKTLAFCVLVACNWTPPSSDEGMVADTLTHIDTLAALDTSSSILDSSRVVIDSSLADNIQNQDTVFLPPSKTVDTKNVNPQELVAFAKTLIGVPYVYASSHPQKGFDCSGFITYVFNHFGISVPRSSIDFTNVGQTIPVEQARIGDLILFTGTNPMERHVGHMGLVTTNSPEPLQFIHSTSGKAMGVTITPLNEYYKSRFVKVIRIFHK